MAVVKDLVQLNAEIQEQKERVENVDFKMITFSLAGKDYGVDIMNVKEIARADKFTYVPNAASFVKGVYNLRGDIIPIIDLRSFFHLPVERNTDGQENLLILRIEDRVYGTIVDKIDKVVGISTETIQPPHPIFGDINIKYISGVVEKQGSLYIILDVVRIFSMNNEEEKNKARPVVDKGGDYFVPSVEREQRAAADSAMGFVKEGLGAIRHFTVSGVNEEWFAKRFSEWSISRKGDALQLRDGSDADDFLSPFYSPFTGNFWDAKYAAALQDALPQELPSNNVHVWNIGCGKGHETFSLACILKDKYPKSQIKIWANDNDIMAISQAPNMLFEMEEVPDCYRHYLSESKNGFLFNQVIHDMIVFEYHDVQNDNTLPELDIILARDIISFLPRQEQEKILTDFEEKIKSHGMVILGTNEELPGSQWRRVAAGPISLFSYE
jgi:purine-binding chemotaxis protein CheW